VAERGALAAREQRRQPPPLAAQRDVAGGVDAAEHRTQPSRVDGALDHPRGLAGGEQLGAREHTVLPIRERPDDQIAIRGALTTHTVVKAPSTRIRPRRRAGRAARHGRRAGITDNRWRRT
jgi:hypothetical protein